MSWTFVLLLLVGILEAQSTDSLRRHLQASSLLAGGDAAKPGTGADPPPGPGAGDLGPTADAKPGAVTSTLSQIREHLSEAHKLKQQLRVDLEKKHRELEDRLHKEIEEQREKLLEEHRKRVEKYDQRMNRYRGRLQSDEDREQGFEHEIESLQERVQKLHGEEAGDKRHLDSMRSDFENADSQDEGTMRRIVMRARARARQRLRRYKERMNKVLAEADDGDLKRHRECIKRALHHMDMVKGHMPHRREKITNMKFHKRHMQRARHHLRAAIRASEECHRMGGMSSSGAGPLSGAGGFDDYDLGGDFGGGLSSPYGSRGLGGSTGGAYGSFSPRRTSGRPRGNGGFARGLRGRGGRGRRESTGPNAGGAESSLSSDAPGKPRRKHSFVEANPAL